MIPFGDRFTYNNPQIAAVEANLANLADAQIAVLSPELQTMGVMVRRSSVLLRSVRLSEIYSAITTYSDPKIALVLAAAKNPDGTFRYGTETVIKQFLFGTGAYVNPTFNIFVEGIRRVSAELAASLLTGQYAQLSEQMQHSEILEKRALQDLDRILQMPDQSSTTPQPQEDELIKARFFVSDQEFTVAGPDPLELSLFIPSETVFTTWEPVLSYPPGTYSTRQVVSEMADVINAVLMELRANLVAAPVLNADTLHYIDFAVRRISQTIIAESISLRFNTPEIPFTWGVQTDEIDNTNLKSLIFLGKIDSRNGQTGANPTVDPEITPIYLYVRRNLDILPQATDEIIWRAGTGLEPPTITIPFLRATGLDQELLDNQRPSDFVVALLNSLNANKVAYRILGAISRNDPPTEDAVAVLELVSWSASQIMTFVTLDILKVPVDLEITLGNYRTIYSRYSDRPRTLKIPVRYDPRLSGSGSGELPEDLVPGIPQLARPKASTLMRRINDEAEALTGYVYPSH